MSSITRLQCVQLIHSIKPIRSHINQHVRFNRVTLLTRSIVTSSSGSGISNNSINNHSVYQLQSSAGSSSISTTPSWIQRLFDSVDCNDQQVTKHQLTHNSYEWIIPFILGINIIQYFDTDTIMTNQRGTSNQICIW